MSARIVPIRPGIRPSTDASKPSPALAVQIERQRLRLLEGSSVLIVLRQAMHDCADNAIYCDTLKA
ncbi:MAG TPA: hypothetical protein VGL55_17015, partial [Steroidobacteraceae bacterium]